MKFVKRLSVFLLVNILVVATITSVLHLFNIQPYLSNRGIDFSQLIIFCLLWGFGGAFISLGLSRILAKWTQGVRVLNPDRDSLSAREHWLVAKVHEYSRRSGIKTMPEVGIYESPEPNAFATGPTRNRALVAVSTGLLERLSEDEVDGVLAHEVAHISNGDMVTMTLVQGILNAFVMFFARIISFLVSQNVREESRPMVSLITTLVLEMAFSFLAMFAVAFVSRKREFKADLGGAELAGRNKMTRALQALQRLSLAPQETATHEAASLAALKISGRKSSLFNLLSTHPPLAERIARLQE